MQKIEIDPKTSRKAAVMTAFVVSLFILKRRPFFLLALL